MLDWWLDQPIWAIFAILTGAFTTSGLLLYCLTYAPPFRSFALSFSGVVAPFFGSLSVLLALLTGFVASDTWERQKQASRVLQSESDHVLGVFDLSIAASPDMSKIRRALATYVNSVLKDEFPAMARSETSSDTAAALAYLLQEVAQPRIAEEAGSATQAALLSSVLKIRSDRGERLSLNLHRTDDTKWLVLIILGFITQIALAIVHLDKPRAQIAALGIFTMGLVSTLGLIAVHQWPFDGPAAIRPWALEAANKVILLDPTTHPAIAP